MTYEVYLDDRRLPIPPKKIPIKYPGQNKKTNLISGEEINMIGLPGLAEISLDFILPRMHYPSAVWDGSVEGADALVEHLKDLMQAGRPFSFIVIRPVGGKPEDTNMNVTIEDLKVSDDVSEGVDLAVSLTLKEYRPYGAKRVNIIQIREGAAATREGEKREGEPEKTSAYTVVKGDCLWLIAKRLLGNGSRWQEIYDLNRSRISNPNLIYPGQVLTIP